MNKRKGTPCSCESDTLRCGNKVRKIDGISPDPNGEFIIEAGNGIAITTGENKITIVNDAIASSFVAGDNIEINPSGDNLEIRVKDDVSIDNLDVSQDVDVTNDVNVGGDLKVTGDIIQQGSSYETHAEQIYTTKDYIYMREGAVSGLSPGDFSGFEVIKYDGTNDGRLVVDNDGVARVGDVGDEQPLLTREESANLTDGALLKWDATNFKAVDEGTVGDDSHPLKSVNGVLTPVTDPLIKNTASNTTLTGLTVGTGAQSIKNVTITETGWYLINVVIETNTVVNPGGYLLGIAKNVNDGWGQVVHLTNADNLRISMTRVLSFNANDKVYVNLYNGGGVNITVSGRELSIVRLN